MNADLKNFLQPIARVVAATLFIVFTVAFFTVPYVLEQLDGSLTGLSAVEVAALVVAYEPVWAIGTGEVATPDDAQEVCRAIRVRIGELHGVEAAGAVRILYGGSVKSSNIAGIMDRVDVDGVLVGGASLDPDDFVGIIRFRLHPAA